MSAAASDQYRRRGDGHHLQDRLRASHIHPRLCCDFALPDVGTLPLLFAHRDPGSVFLRLPGLQRRSQIQVAPNELCCVQHACSKNSVELA